MIIIVSWNWLQMRTEERRLEFLQCRKIPLENVRGYVSKCPPGSSNFAFGGTRRVRLSLIRNSFRNVIFFCNYLAQLEQNEIPDYLLNYLLTYSMEQSPS
jgi:hypothetical protein